MTRPAPDRPATLSPTTDFVRWPAADLLAALLADGVAIAPNLGRGELLAALQAHRLDQGHEVIAEGALELLPEGFGFVRSPHFDYEASPHDAFVSPSQVRALNLKMGHHVVGPMRPPRGNERYFSLAHVDRVNGVEPMQLAHRVLFAARTPLVATRPLRLPTDDLALRTLAVVAPWCRGQRVLVAAPATWPRSSWLTHLATALLGRDAELAVFVCLLDQRPEDLAAARAHGRDHLGLEVTGTTFDQPPERHVALAEMVLARAMREVEAGRDVVLLVDSLTALTTAAQRAHTASGRWLCPGLDVQAVVPGKRLFAAARACAEGGSLTVVATARTGSDATADAAVLAEFRHRGNSDVVVDPQLAAAGAAVPFDLQQTRTRPEDDDRDAATLQAVAMLRERVGKLAPGERDAGLADLLPR